MVWILNTRQSWEVSAVIVLAMGKVQVVLVCLTMEMVIHIYINMWLSVIHMVISHLRFICFKTSLVPDKSIPLMLIAYMKIS